MSLLVFLLCMFLVLVWKRLLMSSNQVHLYSKSEYCYYDVFCVNQSVYGTFPHVHEGSHCSCGMCVSVCNTCVDLSISYYNLLYNLSSGLTSLYSLSSLHDYLLLHWRVKVRLYQTYSLFHSSRFNMMCFLSDCSEIWHTKGRGSPILDWGENTNAHWRELHERLEGRSHPLQVSIPQKHGTADKRDILWGFSSDSCCPFLSLKSD